PHPDDGGQGTDGPRPEGPLEKPRQRRARVRAPTQAEDVEPRTTAEVPGRGAAEHRRDPRPKSPGAVRHGTSRLRRVRGGTRAHAEDRVREGRGDRAPRQRSVRGRADAPGRRGFLYQEMFLAYLITYFLSCYFMAAIVGASFVRLQGGHPTVMDGVEAANASFFQILVWSMCAATVGLLFRLTAIRSDAGGRIV